MKKIYILYVGLIMMECKNVHSNEPKIMDLNVDEDIVHLTDAQRENVEIVLGKIQSAHLKDLLKVNGKIDVPPQSLISISCPIGGYLKETTLLPGVHVRKGEVLATIEDQQIILLQQEYLRIKSKLQYATLDYKRQSELNETKASSDKVMQQSLAEKNNLTIDLAAAAERLKLIHIDPATLNNDKLVRSIQLYSPIDGFITKVNVNIGKFVSPSEILFELVDPRDIHLNLKVFEKDLRSLKIGQKLSCFTNSEPKVRYRCNIILISRDVKEDGSVEIHCHFDTYDKSLLPGMYMNAEIEMESELKNTLPEEALVHYNNSDFIFYEIEKNTFKMQGVKTGKINDRIIEIVELNAQKDSNIVIKGAYTLLMQLKNKEE